MLSRKQAVGKMYGLRSIVDGMISAVDSEVLTFVQATDTIAAHMAKIMREGEEGDSLPRN